VAAAADPVTRTYSVKVGLKAQDALPLGSTVTVLPKALNRSGAQAIKLPTSALRQDGGKTAVWVLDPASMQVRSVPITVDTADANEAVVSAGLSPGMLVVSTGVHVLSPGQKVSLYAQPPTSAASAASAPTAKGL
jgi:multidrug efflux pump subunit AcrA (membrane-fusion protein)